MILSALGMVMPVLAEVQEPLARPRVSEAAQVEQAAEARIEAQKSTVKEATPAKLKVKKANVSRMQIDEAREAGKVRSTDASVKRAKTYEPLKATPLQVTPARKTSDKK